MVPNALPAGQSSALDQLRQLCQSQGFAQTWASGPVDTPTGDTAAWEASAISYFVTFGNTISTQQTPQGIHDHYNAQGKWCSYVEVWERDDTVLGVGDVNFAFIVAHQP